MAIYNVLMPDAVRRGERRSIVWDSGAGTVAGEHSCVGDLRESIEEVVAAGGVVQEVGGRWRLLDPWHDPADFLRTLWLLITNVSWDPDGLPDALRGVEPTPFEAAPPAAWRDSVIISRMTINVSHQVRSRTTDGRIPSSS